MYPESIKKMLLEDIISSMEGALWFAQNLLVFNCSSMSIRECCYLVLSRLQVWVLRDAKKLCAANTNVLWGRIAVSDPSVTGHWRNKSGIEALQILEAWNILGGHKLQWWCMDTMCWQYQCFESIALWINRLSSTTNVKRTIHYFPYSL